MTTLTEKQIVEVYKTNAAIAGHTAKANADAGRVDYARYFAREAAHYYLMAQSYRWPSVPRCPLCDDTECHSGACLALGSIGARS